MTFSWRRGMLFGLIPFGLVAIISAVMIGTDQVVRVEEFTEGVTKVSLFVFGLGIGISYLAQTGRRPAAIGLGAALLVGIVALFGVPMLTRHKPRVLDPADRAPLARYQDHGEARLRHPTLGFSIHDPGPAFAPSDTLAAAMQQGAKADASMWSYGYLKGELSQPEAAVIVSVVDDADFSESEFRRTVKTIVAGIRKPFEAGGLTVTADDVVWTETKHESHFHGVIPGAGEIFVNTYAMRPANREACLVALIAIARDVPAVDHVMSSFDPGR